MPTRDIIEGQPVLVVVDIQTGARRSSEQMMAAFERVASPAAP